MTSPIGNPTLGSIIQYLVKSSGLLASKHPEYGGFVTETEKKSFQTSLQRLANENSNLIEASEDALRFLIQKVDTINRSPDTAIYLQANLMAMLGDFRKMVAEYHSPLDRSLALEALIRTRLADWLWPWFQNFLFVDDRVRINHLYQLIELRLTVEDSTWQPSDWLRLSYQWGYEQLDTHQRGFHNPNGLAADYQERQRHENVGAWSRGKHVPSWGQMHYDFDASWEDYAASHPELSGQSHLKSLWISLLFFGRWFMALESDLRKWLSLPALSELSKRFNLCCRHFSVAQSMAISELYEATKAATRDNALSQFQVRQRYFKAWLDEFWLEKVAVSDQYLNATEPKDGYIDPVQFAYDVMRLVPLTSARLLCRKIEPRLYPNMSTQLALDQSQALMVAVRRKKINTELQFQRKLKRLRKKMESTQDLHRLNWMLLYAESWWHWNEGRLERAFITAKLAFEEAKYTAGRHQYKLVQHLLELSAKTKNKATFRKVYYWALYLDIPIRLARGITEGSEDEKIDFVYEFYGWQPGPSFIN